MFHFAPLVAVGMANYSNFCSGWGNDIFWASVLPFGTESSFKVFSEHLLFVSVMGLFLLLLLLSLLSMERWSYVGSNACFLDSCCLLAIFVLFPGSPPFVAICAFEVRGYGSCLSVSVC